MDFSRGKLCLLVCALGLGSACASSPASSGGDTKGSAKAEFGARCGANADCATGLFCLDSDYSPFKWCTRFCATEGAQSPCSSGSLGSTPGLCIQMPPGSRGPSQPFCAPVCGKLAECTSLEKTWETCEKPAYKKIVLYNALPTKVCMAASANGQPVVDPLTCDWTGKVTDPKFDQVKGDCTAYCQFKTTCQLFDPNKEHADCCTWHCFQHLTPGNVVDNAAESCIKCYIKAYAAFQNTDQVCTGWQSQCFDNCGNPP